MPADSLSATFAALADPTRRAILARLASGECSVTELAEPFEMSMPAVSKHLRVLERAGLVARGRDAQWRPCRLEAAPLKEVADWAERYRHIWEGRLDRLDAYLQCVTRQGSRKSKEKTHARHAAPQIAARSRSRRRRTPRSPDPALRRAAPARVGRDDEARARPPLVGLPLRGPLGHRLRNRPARRRQVALRRRGPEGESRRSTASTRRSTGPAGWSTPRSSSPTRTAARS